MSIHLVRCRTHNRGERRRPFQVFQIQLDSEGKRVRRNLSEADGEIIRGPWVVTARPFAPGLYCMHCVNEGNRTPLPIDELDMQEAGLTDPPLVFIDPQAFNGGRLVESLREKFGERIHYVQELPERDALYADASVVDRLHPGLRRALRERILPQGNLYAFQAKALQAALDGHDTIVTTPTASGKSLTYTLPIIDTLLRDPRATALYLSPLVALTEDQLESLTRLDSQNIDWVRRGERFSIHRFCRTLDTGSGTLTVARYDGSVPEGDRQDIRQQQPQYILTTPDMLHAAILSGAFNQWQWHYLFSGLRYVVIDELHSYRGVVGASFANLIRRLRRICRMLGANPQFLCASATLVEPEATVEQLIGRRPVLIDATDAGAPQRKRHFVLWNEGVGTPSSSALSTQAKNVLLHLIEQRTRSIAFGRSISEINDIYRFTTAELRDEGMRQTVVQPFMRELLPEDKRRIIADLKQKRLHCVIATSALSMGIDIGSLSAAVMIGFPGSIAQLWQQAGRAGRSGEGVVILIADNNPLDQFFVVHPDVLFNLRAEPVYCNPNNPYIVRNHMLRAAQEAPLTQDDIALFGDVATEQITILSKAGLLTSNEQGEWILTPAGLQKSNVGFRNMAFSVPVRTSDQKLVVEVDAVRAQRALHRHAHYQHIDNYYRVVRCDLDWEHQRGEIIVQPLEHPEFTTTAKVESRITIVQRHLQQSHIGFKAEYGLVNCHSQVSGYYKVPLFVRGGPFTFQPLGRAAPPPLAFQTQAFWLTLPSEVLADQPSVEQEAALYSLAGAVRLATAIEALCDPSDIQALGFSEHPDTGLPTLMLYDAVPGGIGIAETAFTKIEQVLLRAEQILADCPHCSQHPTSRGCPYCVTAQYGDETTINRLLALALLNALRKDVEV